MKTHPKPKIRPWTGVLCVQIQEEIFQTECGGYSQILAGSLVFHCILSAPFSATVLKESKQIKVLQGITSQNTASLQHEYIIY